MSAIRLTATSGLLLAVLAAPASAPAVGFGVNGEVDYQRRNFRSGGMEYDLDYGGISVRPTIRITDRWAVYALLGYSRLVFDRPDFDASEYDQWGFCWGAGTSYTLFRWSGLSGVIEGEFSRSDSERNDNEEIQEEGRMKLWGAEARAGWDFTGVSIYAGEAYTGGRLDYSYSSDAREIGEEYDLEENWRPFAGARVNIPPFTNLEGRYYFGKGMIALFSVGVDF
jgi:opacity protein-like surface antigen